MSAPNLMSRVWLLSLVPAVKGGRWISGLLIFLVMVGVPSMAGIFAADRSSFGSPGVMLFFAVILAYIVPVVHFIAERAQRALDDLATPLGLDAERLAAEKRRVVYRSRRWTVFWSATGLTAAIAHNTLLYYAIGDSVLDVGNPLQLVGLFGSTAVWLVMTAAVATLMDIAIQFNRLARSVDVDILNASALTPFGRVAVISTLAMIGAQAAFPIMWIDDRISSAVTMVPGLIATAIPMVALFALPAWPIHRRIARAKRVELQRIGGWISTLRGSSPAPTELAELDRLAPLLSYRAEIERVSEWPFNAGLLTRLGFYLIIPPLTWVGAALVEFFLEDVV